MKLLALTALAILTAAAIGCIDLSGWQTVHGSGTITTATRAVSDFDQVSVSGAGELRVAQGDQESLTIEADDNLLPFIRSEVEHGHLFIGPHNVNLRASKPIVYRLNLKHLTQLHLSGSVRGQADSIAGESLGIDISGSGKMTVAQLEAQRLSAAISGSGSTSVTGHAETQKISISGSGDHHAADLRCARAEVHISGSGNASLWVTESLAARISGSGNVTYRGKAAVDSHVSGSGRVHGQPGPD